MAPKSQISPQLALRFSCNLMWHMRFCWSTYACSFPPKSDFPYRIRQQMAPKLNISDSTPNFAFAKSLILRISGAMKPGVPHLTKIQDGSSVRVAKPKSTSLTDSRSAETMMFYGFMSRCTIFNFFISSSPDSRLLKIFFLCSWESVLFLRRKTQRVVPSTYSMERYSEFLVSQTPWSLATLGQLIIRMILIQFSIPRLPSPLKATSFMKALTATWRFLRRSSARQTVAKFPLPIFFNGLKNSWKSLLVTRASSISSHSCALGQKSLSSSTCSFSFLSSMPTGPSLLVMMAKVREGSMGMVINLCFWRILSSVGQRQRSVNWLSSRKLSLMRCSTSEVAARFEGFSMSMLLVYRNSNHILIYILETAIKLSSGA